MSALPGCHPCPPESVCWYCSEGVRPVTTVCVRLIRWQNPPRLFAIAPLGPFVDRGQVFAAGILAGLLIALADGSLAPFPRVCSSSSLGKTSIHRGGLSPDPLPTAFRRCRAMVDLLLTTGAPVNLVLVMPSSGLRGVTARPPCPDRGSSAPGAATAHTLWLASRFCLVLWFSPHLFLSLF